MLNASRHPAPRAPQLLVSVRNADEAAAALRGGADIIDIKEPSRGSLGRADDCASRAVIDMIASRQGEADQHGKRPAISAAMGELADTDSLVVPQGLTYYKLGLAHSKRNWRDRLAAAWQEVAHQGSGARPIAVAYADWEAAGAPPVADVMDFATQHAAAGLLVDTWAKDGQGLFKHMDEDAITGCIAAARDANLLVALAGSLTHDTLARAAVLVPDVLAIRGAACDGADRCAAVTESRVRQAKQVISLSTAPATEMTPPAG